MEGGDISNSAPATVMVHVDVILKRTEVTTKTLGVWAKTSERVDLDLDRVNTLYRVGLGITASLECFCTNGRPLTEWIERLDHLNLNPFRYFTVYPDVKSLLDELAYRPTVAGVVDPERQGRYGSRGMDLGRLMRI